METRSRKRARVALEHSRRSFSVSIDKDSLEEILSKLPVKSLIRFRCVSQELCALTQNPSFISKQHLSCSDPDTYLFLDKYPPSTIDDENTDDEVFGFTMFDSNSKFTRLDLSFMNNNLHDIYRVASSNGLVCLYALHAFENRVGSEESIIVCNPATKQFRYLPIPTPFKIGGHKPLLGFEFLYDIGEYKLASIFLEALGDEEELVTFRAQVWTQRSNSWRKLNHEMQFPSSINDCSTRSSFTCNGVLYWLVKKTRTDSFFVLSFSLHNEAFMPAIQLPPMKLLPGIFLWKSSPALLVTSPDGWYMVLWVMKTESSGRMPPSWNQQCRYKISSAPKALWWVGVLNNQFLLMVDDGQYVLYDPARRKTRKFPKHEATKLHMRVINYVQSLLPV